ncbi:AraC family transcriptional regulator [Chitinophaga pendula]|uniref:helix-turn-helix transcriptional regulator n=1 Tax=Chitinophaga TaxID=79328 RepID=UPI0012FE203C|nr:MULTISPECIES: AraC family transcriptional regulator [Chitinophaga]UCJ08196.1 AraC family transcriptional regulator [Chitinophaga pendula]
MSITITNETMEVFHQPALRLYPDKLSAPQVTRESRDEHYTFWDSYFEQLYFDGMHAGFCTAEVHHDIYITSEQTSAMPGMVFLQRGGITAIRQDYEGPQHLGEQQHNFVFDPYATATTMIRGQSQLDVFVLSFLPERFLQLVSDTGPVMDRIAESIAASRPFTFRLQQHMPITPKMQALITEIRQCRYPEGLKKLFLQSRVLELLALQCEQLEAVYGHKQKCSKLTPADIRKVQLAKEILLSDIQHPPSLTELCRQVGLNEFKLKVGFKEVFHHTVFGYLKAFRMERARTLLANRSMSVTEIAYEMGYASLHHFSNEFKKHFGVSPASMR